MGFKLINLAGILASFIQVALLMLAPWVALQAQGLKPFVINGQLLNAPQQYVYLQGEGRQDSVWTDNEGYFTFRGENTEELEYQLRSKIPNRRRIPLALYNQTVNLAIDAENDKRWPPLGEVKIEGSPASWEINYNIRVITNAYARQFRVLLTSLDDLMATGDSVAIGQKQTELASARTNWFYSSKTNVDATHSPVTAFNLLLIMETALQAVPPNDQLTQDLAQSYERAKNKFPSSSLLQSLYASYRKQNTVTPTLTNLNDLPFTLPSQDGELISYQTFAGKLVLVDFWASWCKPCREEHPTLRKAYRLFGGDGFTIVSISIDKAKDRAQWLSAIQKDEVGGWTHLLNALSPEQNVIDRYGINAVPSNLLISPDGTVVGRNLRGDKLIEAIQQQIKR